MQHTGGFPSWCGTQVLDCFKPGFQVAASGRAKEFQMRGGSIVEEIRRQKLLLLLRIVFAAPASLLLSAFLLHCPHLLGLHSVTFSHTG